MDFVDPSEERGDFLLWLPCVLCGDPVFFHCFLVSVFSLGVQILQYQVCSCGDPFFDAFVRVF